MEAIVTARAADKQQAQQTQSGKGQLDRVGSLRFYLPPQTTTRILAVVFLLPQLVQCFMRDSEILVLGRSEISETARLEE